MSYLAIVNPAAGGGRCGSEFPAALERLREAGLEIDVATTKAAGEATQLARDAWNEGRRRFIAVGGDGTTYEVVNGLFPAAARSDDVPELGFLPMGTGNSFLRDFTENGAEHSMQALVEQRTRACDVIRLEHRRGVLHYINILSIGFVADVNGLRARRFSSWGEAGYVFAVVTEVAGLHSRPFPMKIDDGAFDRDPMVFASFNNSRFTGGKMMMAPDADTGDGLIDLVRVAPLSRLNLLRTFPKIFKGTHVHNPAVTTAKVRTVEFELDEEIDIMIDGEADRVIPTRLDVLPGALRVHA
jgi:YegS/Rv2252/BmrU family lipid kinase